MPKLSHAALGLLLRVSNATDGRYDLTESEYIDLSEAPDAEFTPEVRELISAKLVDLGADDEEAPVYLSITDLGLASLEESERLEKVATIKDLPGEARDLLEGINSSRGPAFYPELSPKDRAGLGTLEELGLIESASLSGAYLFALTTLGDLALKYAEARDREENYRAKAEKARGEADNFLEAIGEVLGKPVRI